MKDHSSNLMRLEEELTAVDNEIKKQRALLDQAAAKAIVQNKKLGEDAEILALDEQMQKLLIRQKKLLSGEDDLSIR